MLFKPPKRYRRALTALQEVQRHQRTLLTLDTSAADVAMARDALQQRVEAIWKTVEADREVYLAAAEIQRMLATADDPGEAILAMTEAQLQRRLRDGT